MTSRRDVTAMVGGAIFASAGCLQRIAPERNANESNDDEDTGGATKEFPIDDVSVHNDRNETVEVTVSVTRNSESVFEKTFDLAPDETKVYEDVMKNEREYEVTVRADGLSKTVTFDEHRDNAGVRFSIGWEKIESSRIVH